MSERARFIHISNFTRLVVVIVVVLRMHARICSHTNEMHARTFAHNNENIWDSDFWKLSKIIFSTKNGNLGFPETKRFECARKQLRIITKMNARTFSHNNEHIWDSDFWKLCKFIFSMKIWNLGFSENLNLNMKLFDF